MDLLSNTWSFMPAGCPIDLHIVADALLLWVPLHARVRDADPMGQPQGQEGPISNGKQRRGRQQQQPDEDQQQWVADKGMVAALSAAAEALTWAAQSDGLQPQLQSWEHLSQVGDEAFGPQWGAAGGFITAEGHGSAAAAAAAGESTAVGAEQLQDLEIILHNAASALGSIQISSDGEAAAHTVLQARLTACLLSTAFHCSVRRYRMEQLATDGSDGSCWPAAEDVARRAMACISGLVRCAAANGGGADAGGGAQLLEEASRVITQLIVLLGPQQLLRQQHLLLALLKLHVKLQSAVEAAAKGATAPQAPSGRGRGKGKAQAGKAGPLAYTVSAAPLTFTEQLVSGAAAEAHQLVDVVAFLEVQCFVQVEAKQGLLGDVGLQQRAQQVLRAAAACPPPCGWGAAEWGAHMQLITTFCGASDAPGLLAAAASALRQEAQGSPVGQSSKAQTKGTSKRTKQAACQESAEASMPPWLLASRHESAALCSCLLALQGAQEAAAVAGAAAATGSWTRGQDDALEELSHRQQEEQPSSSCSSGASSGSSSRGAGRGKGRTSRKGAGAARSGAGASGDQGVWSDEAMARWTSVRGHLEIAVQLWLSAVDLSAAVDAVDMDGGSGTAGSTAGWQQVHVVCRFPAASSQVLLQAWHIAAIQGWTVLQQRLASIAPWILGCLAQSELQQLAPALACMVEGNWLEQLLCPGLPAANLANRVSMAAPASGLSTAAAAAFTGDLGRELAAVQLAARHQQLQQVVEAHESEVAAAGGHASPWVGIHGARLHLAAAQAAFECGELPAAFAAAERALALSGRVHLACAAPGTAGGASAAGEGSEAHQNAAAAPMDVDGGSDRASHSLQKPAEAPTVPVCGPVASTAAAADVLLRWQSLGLYLSSLHMLATVHETAGCPDEALRLLRDEAALAAATQSAAFGAAAHGAMSRVWCKRGDMDRAVAQLQLAERCLAALMEVAGDGGASAGGGCRGNPQNCDRQDDGKSGDLAAALSALVACAAGDVALAGKDLAAASARYAAAAALVDPAVLTGSGIGGGRSGRPGSSSSTSSSGEGASRELLVDGNNELGWWMVHLWAEAKIGLARCHKQVEGDSTAAASCLVSSLQLLQEASWPAASAALALELLTLQPPDWLAPPTRLQAAAGALHLIAFGDATDHSNLLEEFAGAALEDQDDASTADAGRQSVRGAKGKSRGKGRGSAGGEKGARGQKQVAGSRAAGGERDGGTADVAAAGASTAYPPGRLLQRLLRLLWPLRHTPLLLKRACALLARVCEQQGALHACAFFLQLSLGECSVCRCIVGCCPTHTHPVDLLFLAQMQCYACAQHACVYTHLHVRVRIHVQTYAHIYTHI